MSAAAAVGTPPTAGTPAPAAKSGATVAGAGAGSAKEFAAKVAEIVRLEEQLARRRMEAMNLLALMEANEDAGLASPSTSTIRKASMSGAPAASRLEAYKHGLFQDSARRLVAMSDWTSSSPSSGEMSLTAGDSIQCWYTSSSVAWGFGAVTKDGKETSGWFPLFATRTQDELDQSRSRAVSAPVAPAPGTPKTAVAEVKKLDAEGFAIKVFNMKAKKGIRWIKEQLYKGGEMADADADAAIGHFLWDHRNELSKDELGDLFGEDTDEAKRIYNAFVSKFNVTGLDLDLALRRLLYVFKLPGEAQKIDRIMK